MADFKRGGVDKTDAATRPKTRAQIGTHRHQGSRHPFDEALIAHASRKLTRPLYLHLLLIIGFEVPVTQLMEGYQNRPAFTQAQASSPVTVLDFSTEQ